MSGKKPGNEETAKKESRSRRILKRLRHSPIARSGTSVTAQRLELVVTAANSASMGMIFAFREFLPRFFRGLGRSILFPFNAACNIIRAVLALYEAHKEGYKTPALIRALVAVASGLAISIAIIGALVATAAFTVLGPVLSVIGFTLRSLYHSATAIYFGVQGYFATEAKESAKFWDKMITNTVSAVQSILNVAAITMVLLAFKATFGIMGLVAGAVGAVYQIYRAANLTSPLLPPPPVEAEADLELKEKVEPEPQRRNTIDLGVDELFQKRADKRKPVTPPSPTVVGSLSSTFYGSRSQLSRGPSPYPSSLIYNTSYADFQEWGVNSQELSRPPSVAPMEFNRHHTLSPTNISRQTTEATASQSPSSVRRHSF